MSTTWRADGTATDPAFHTLTALDNELLSFDTTNLLADGDEPTSPSVECVRLDTNRTVTLADGPLVSGVYVLQRVRGLTAGLTYRLRVRFTTGGNVRTMTLHIVVAR